MQKYICTAVLVFLGFVGSAIGQTSKEYAVMARSTWSAFECSSLAAQMKDSSEQERLFMYGYKEGLAFLTALQSKKIQRQDLSTEAPWLMLLLLQGPTPDFMLGRVFESAQDTALKNILKTGDKLNADEVRRMLAQGDYNKQNCRLIGNTK